MNVSSDLFNFSFFIQFGPISFIKIPPGKGCVFITFTQRESAELAIKNVNGTVFGKFFLF